MEAHSDAVTGILILVQALTCIRREDKKKKKDDRKPEKRERSLEEDCKSTQMIL
jgi:hypothetical protein